ncbi:hypothetical protein MUK70_19180 [Dyadobacter chenwenxiniae]|uniref:Lipoprotein n=1 Tax=Dyadobacter chenwenxiniae TaxID=2906456 RepID=A0A9X1PHY9_9BACT|nr:hypothetical protein [Dyadobacter chenwenxiniae]MCF0061365.1 hypothetical protein [Dyadobacter chenwenxiniae]UON81187.1 hypothetical protein MUK70_19180 [Dyadobacter chenwenxiniae]
MKKILALVFVALAAACSENFPNPPIKVELGRPFILQNTDRNSIPEGHEDVAVFPSEENPELTFELNDVIDLRCPRCDVALTSYAVTISINGKEYFLGEVNNDEIKHPNGKVISREVMLMNKTLLLQNVEQIASDKFQNANVKHKKVTLLLLER